MFGRVARRDGDAASGEVGRVLGVRIATGDPDTAKSEELGEGAHPGAGDAHEVHRTRVCGIEEAGHDCRTIKTAQARLKCESAVGRGG